MIPRGSILLPFDLDARRDLARANQTPDRAPFAALADSLAHDLAPLLDTEPPIPAQKARLTRHGGRCPEHGTFLEFDPWSPHDHWCTRCARAYRGARHDDWWAMGAQLWTAERAVHAAALFALRGNPRHGALAARILRTVADRYISWPNSDNVLGPTRPFFSTYLESIWLLNLCHALALLEGRYEGWSDADASDVRARIIEPSAALIDGYREGGSNRQVWNEVAVSSAWCLLGRERDARARLDAEGGLRWQIANGLDDAGSWYEGENYHLFAHRGLWYGVQLMRALHEPLAPALDRRYSAGFIAPFAGLLPDDTFPSRRDSQYASSIRQWRTAEWCELGWTHTHDRRIAGILSRLYDGQAPRRDTGRARSTADAERNTPASALTRADLSWRALLMAEGAAAPAVAMPSASVCLPAQGLAVIRRDAGRTYVALEGGQLGGGHGHPDQLALTLQTGEARWLDDPGTGSYVEEELAWYRSTLAHAAPLVDRASQAPVPATLVAFEERDRFAWMVKRVDGIADGVHVERTIVVGDGYLVDVLEWQSDVPHTIELPIAGRADVDERDGNGWSPASDGEPRHDALSGMIARPASMPVGDLLALRAYPAFADPMSAGAEDRARVWYSVHAAADAGCAPALVQRATVPAAPWHGRTDRHWLVAYGARGRMVGVWSWPSAAWPEGRVSGVQLGPDAMPCVRVTTFDGVTAAHARGDGGWRIDLEQDGVRERVWLAGFRSDPPVAAPAPVTAETGPRAEYLLASSDERPDLGAPGSPIRGAIMVTLAESHYVRTEQSWHEAGAPTAMVQIAATPRWLVVDVHARTGPLVTHVPDPLGRLDNEVPDVNADGLQWYMARDDVAATPSRDWHSAALHVPGHAAHASGGDRVTTLVGNDVPPRVVSTTTPDGWAMRLSWPRASLPLDANGALRFDLVVNERPPGRERRRGQLVLSGGGGFGYLMGSRRPTQRFVRLVMPPGRAETTLR